MNKAMIRIGAQLATAALFATSIAFADPVPECAVSETAAEPVAPTPEASAAPAALSAAGEANATAEQEGAVAQEAAAQEAAAQEGQVAPSSARRLQAWALNVREMLSLREFIQTTPLVVGGMKVYLETEPVAVMQSQSTSQLTFAFALDKVVLRGAF